MADQAPKAEVQHTKAHVGPDTNVNAPAQNETTTTSTRNAGTEDQVKKSSAVPAKRKVKSKTAVEPSKAPRRSARRTPSVAPVKMLQFLLTPESLDLCRPKDETEDIKTRGDIKTYSASELSPFEELVCAVVLSRPISHALGLRTIRTIFNDPFNFNTPKAILAAGPEGRQKALDSARTQHRQKTAEELRLLADLAKGTIGDGEDDFSLEKVRRDGEHDSEKEGRIIVDAVKGFGKTGLDIFSRRIQGVWPAFYPSVDPKTAAALEGLGLPTSADDLNELMLSNWSDLDVEYIDSKDDAEKKRKAFVRILERAVGAELEGNMDEVKAKAA